MRLALAGIAIVPRKRGNPGVLNRRGELPMSSDLAKTADRRCDEA